MTAQRQLPIVVRRAWRRWRRAGLGGARWTSALTALAVGLLVGLAGLLLALKERPERLGLPAPAPEPPPSDAAAANSLPASSTLPAAAASGVTTATNATAASAPTALASAAGSAACPADMVLIEGNFCPALPYTCIEYVDEAAYRCARYARGARCQLPLDPRRYCIDRYEWPNKLGAQPTVFVDWNEAKAACAAVDKRLCRRSEWVLACEGPKGLPYPWGYRRRPSPCNIDRPSIPFDVNAMMRPGTREEELARLWQADRIGSHPDCVSAFGVHDMAGNVDEWTDNQLDDPNTSRPSSLNGGYWGPVRDTCRLTTTKHTPKFRFYQVGFRCCREPLTGARPGARPWIHANERRDKGGEE